MTGGAADPLEWVHKARQDARSARRLLEPPPELEVAAYHLQQAVEKAIKALLTAGGIKYPRGRGGGHDLDALAGLIPGTDPLHAQALALSSLTPWATVFRYPADDPMTAQPLPEEDEIQRLLVDVDTFVEAVARHCARGAGRPSAPVKP